MILLAESRLDRTTLARLIDHTLLKATATPDDIRRLCQEAVEHRFAAVCINPSWVALAREAGGEAVAVCTVIGFPLGAATPATKAAEAAEAVSRGADEVDMVINIGALKGGLEDLVRDEIGAVVQAVRGAGQGRPALVKVIIETCYLTDEEKTRACRLAVAAGAGFVKTSTGFGTGGATAADVALMRRAVGPDVGVKASGGIRNLADALAMIEAGATRIGTSAGVAIIRELPG